MSLLLVHHRGLLLRAGREHRVRRVHGLQLLLWLWLLLLLLLL